VRSENAIRRLHGDHEPHSRAFASTSTKFYCFFELRASFGLGVSRLSIGEYSVLTPHVKLFL
jgi:hypothetical protein